MPVLERRVQVLFDPERFAQLEKLAATEGVSVAAVIRESVEDRLARNQQSKKAVLASFLAEAGETDPTLTDWNVVKDSFERSSIG